jgi:hypothetical protein
MVFAYKGQKENALTEVNALLFVDVVLFMKYF